MECKLRHPIVVYTPTEAKATYQLAHYIRPPILTPTHTATQPLQLAEERYPTSSLQTPLYEEGGSSLYCSVP